jgi:hypothetical protein
VNHEAIMFSTNSHQHGNCYVRVVALSCRKKSQLPGSYPFSADASCTSLDIHACVRWSPTSVDQAEAAPQRPITVNGGFKMPGWYDIFSLGGDIEQRQDAEGLHDAAQCVPWMPWKLVSRVAAIESRSRLSACSDWHEWSRSERSTCAARPAQKVGQNRLISTLSDYALGRRDQRGMHAGTSTRLFRRRWTVASQKTRLLLVVSVRAVPLHS